jgi:hypothetical protein
MTFDEAVELARVINGNSRFAVIAIGRFALQTDLVAAHAAGTLATLAWGVSVMPVDDPQSYTVLRSDDAWREFASVAKSLPKQSAATPPTAKPPVVQGTLF